MFSLLSKQANPRGRGSNRVRPGVEAVEARVLLATAHRPLVVATLGDSLTDEYSFYGAADSSNLSLPTTSSFSLPINFGTIGRSSARNWVLNLAATRSSQVTFGAYSAASRGETRNQGFAENWARSGATASGDDLNATGTTTFAQQLAGIPVQSLPGLLTQAPANSGLTPRDIDVVTILIGANDYAEALTEYAGSLSQVDPFAPRRGGVNAVNAGIEAAIKAAVTRVRQQIPRAKVVIVTPPDITISPLVGSALAAGASVFPDLSRTVTASVGALNADLARFARQKNVGLVNTQAVFNRFRAAPAIDGVRVNLQGSGQDLTDGFVGDGFHPGTILQGVLARAIVAKIDAMSGRQVIRPIAGGEIVAYARATQPTIALDSGFEAGAEPTMNPRVTLRAIVGPGSISSPTPTGAVSFEVLVPATAAAPAHFGTILGTATLDASGTATLVVGPGDLSGGPVYAVYHGDPVTDARVSNSLTPTIAPVSTATTTVVVPTRTTLNGQPVVRFDVAVYPTDGGFATRPAGTVTLRVAGSSPLILTLTGGEAAVTLPSKQVHKRFVMAAYGGDAAFGASQSPRFRPSVG